MKCNFCDNKKYVDRLNNKGVLENYCVECISKLNSNKNGEPKKLLLLYLSHMRLISGTRYQ